MLSNTDSGNIVADLKRHIFVFELNENKEQAVAQRLKDAYERLKSLDISVSWHQTSEPPPNQDANCPVVFVMEPFGTAFFQEIRHDFRIISPICLFTCLNLAVKIPISSCRCLANLALRKCIVCSSCFTREEVSEIEERVKLMGGVYSGKFMNNTTHLITNEVHSQKYSSAYTTKTPVVLRSWLDEAWTLGCSNPQFTALNRSFTRLHSCPVFSKCNVVVTAFIGTEREEVISLLQVNGAKYSDSIIVVGEHQTTHLVAKRPGSQKYASAVHSCLRIVSKEWVTNCIEKGYRLPERDYPLEMKFITSISKTRSPESEEMSETLNQLKLELGPCEPILDGCRVYLCGFSEPQLQRVNKILNMCKATRVDKLSAGVTHAVLGCPTQEQLSQINCLTPPPSHVIKYNWLVECWRQRAVVPEYDYLVNLSDKTGEGESSRDKSFGLRQREDTRSSANSELFSQYIKVW